MDITSTRDKWIDLDFALVNLFGDDGRVLFHSFCIPYMPGYDETVTDAKYTELLNSSRIS